MSKLLQAINTMLVSTGEESVEDLNEPSSIMAKATLDFVLNELPYTTNDFELSYETIPKEVYNYVVLKATRRFQNQMVGSEILYQFTAEDEMEAKRKLVKKELIPKHLLAEVENELNEQSDLGELVPTSLKQSMALMKFQALLFANNQEFLIPYEVLQGEYIAFKRKLIINRVVPSSLLEKVKNEAFARYGFSGVIPEEINNNEDITNTLRLLASYEFQKAILDPEQFVITVEEKNQDEIDLRNAIIVSKIVPSSLLDKAKIEFLNMYGLELEDLTPFIRDYIKNVALFNLQTILIPNKEIRPISQAEMDDNEASLLTRLIIPKELYQRVYDEVKIELGIHSEVEEDLIPEAVRIYAKYKGALIHQSIAIRYQTNYVISQLDVTRAKANASSSLPSLTLLDSKAVARLTDKETTPERTQSAVSEKYRLRV